MDEASTVESMRDYYARRAAYYERVYLKPERQRDLRAMEAWLPSMFVDRRVLEVACGTGWWTPHGASLAREWLATDLNAETIELARRKEMPSCVRFEIVDAYTFAELGERRFDAAFAGCWWSHVPLGRLPRWLDALHGRLESGARVVMLDNSYVQSSRTPSNTPISRRDADGNTYQQRTLDDGSVHEVLKNFPTREQAFSMLGERAVEPQWIQHEHYWALSYGLT
jgi:demethylmenaquinone methyltransferase/2-methoxy-6-polyprenyl-1,4-benzoquinol methylase